MRLGQATGAKCALKQVQYSYIVACMYYRDYEQCLACFKNAMPTFFGSLNGFHEIVLILQKK